MFSSWVHFAANRSHSFLRLGSIPQCICPHFLYPVISQRAFSYGVLQHNACSKRILSNISKQGRYLCVSWLHFLFQLPVIDTEPERPVDDSSNWYLPQCERTELNSQFQWSSPSICLTALQINLKLKYQKYKWSLRQFSLELKKYFVLLQQTLEAVNTEYTVISF